MKKYLIIKRTIDLIISGLLLICLFPILIIIMALLAKYNKGAGVFFMQRRPGRGGEIFEVIKFKTMTDEKDRYGNLLPDEKRVTKVGEFIRKMSLDEIPQLINVLKGEMSLIGPRPLLIEYLPLYSENQRKRHDVRPGITGWAQVNGRNSISWTKKFELDIYYVDNLSFALDCKILFMTILKVLKRDGINSSEESIGIEDFNGYN